MTMTRDLEMEVKREAEFIEALDGSLYLPRPSGWLAGWMRHMWFQNRMNKAASIIPPERWTILSKAYGTKVLVEYANGMFGVIDES
jgi:hypothetical protein